MLAVLERENKELALAKYEGDKMPTIDYRKRLENCSRLMKEEGLNVLLLTKPANMFYLTGDGRLCAYAMITQDGKVALAPSCPTLRLTWSPVCESPIYTEGLCAET